MKSLKFKVVIVILFAVFGIIFWQTKGAFKMSLVLDSGLKLLSNLHNTATATTSINNPVVKLTKKQAHRKINKKISENKFFPLGINNPFSYPDIDKQGEDCLKRKGVLMSSAKTGRSYSETHISASDVVKCLPVSSKYMKDIKDIGVNVISQHFVRRYDENGTPYFGIEEKGHINHEVAIQLYVGGFNNYFWLATNPLSGKGFIGDIDVETHKIITENKISQKQIYLPASEAGFAEWQRWLVATLDYLDDHDALDNITYIQIGNESDGDYTKKDKVERDSADDFYWSAYAKLVEKSYDIIKSKSSKIKIAIGAAGGGSVTFGGFQTPTLEYLSGKTDENGQIINGKKKCGNSGCFDVYDYHDFSGYKEYKGRTACQPRSCINPIITVEKTPQNMKKILSDSGFSDKKLVIQQGGTYTGQDGKVNQMEEYQTEEDQASYLAKRAIYLLANGADQVQSATYIEHYGYKDSIHNWFTMMGFVYNGIPQEENIKQKKNNKKADYSSCDNQLPCPDPGEGVKKLSYFTYKKLIEILKGSDTSKIVLLETKKEDTYLYKIDNGGETAYFAWWDWWNKCPRPDSSKPEMNTECVNKNKPTVFIDVGSDIYSVKITEIVPNFNSGKEAGRVGYSNAFKNMVKETKEGSVAITLGIKPVYIKTER